MRKPYLLLTAVLLGVLISGMAYALPNLQLDIVDGYYRTSDETTVSTSDSFQLIALLDAIDYSGTYYISVAIVPKTSPPGGDLGSFTINGQQINATSGMTYGTAPLEQLVTLQGWDSGDLQKHGIYETYYYQFTFTFSGTEVGAYDTQTGEAQQGNTLYNALFNVNVAGLNEGYQVHFDLYNTKVANNLKANNGYVDIDVNDFAPFSHDAESGPPPVPEPATLILLGSGLLGLAGFKRKV